MDFNCKRCAKTCTPELKAQKILIGKCSDFEPVTAVKRNLIEDIYKDIESINYLDEKEKQNLKIKFMLETTKLPKL